MATTRKRTVKRPVAKKKTAKKTASTTSARKSSAGRSAAGSDGTRASATKKSTRKKSVPKTSTAKTSTAKTSTAKTSTAKRSTSTSRRSSSSAPLAEYNRKRDFSRTKEPAGTVPKSSSKALRFVVQKHEASHLHYDFRLELDGVMKSWAVPKGPSYDPSVRRLAMEVEDHPISYNTFEGTIPAGEYGGGTVMLWDRGTYEAEDGGGVESLRRGYQKGDLKIVMHGKRLRGGWVLVRMNRPGRPQWLLIKHRDDTADPTYDVTEEEVTSVTTDRTMDEIAAGTRVWHSNR
jgi:bifunctional non-homologous end joining protein LigD